MLRNEVDIFFSSRDFGQKKKLKTSFTRYELGKTLGKISPALNGSTECYKNFGPYCF